MAAVVPPVASPAEMKAFHDQLEALELPDIYEMIAGRLAKAGWRQLLSYDPKDDFSVAEAEELIKLECVPVADLDMVEGRFKGKKKEWIRASGASYLKRLQASFGGTTAPQRTDMTAAMQRGIEANDDQVRQLLAMPDFPAFEGHVLKGDFAKARELASADTVKGGSRS
eukprot:SAG11_NODE_8351_length_1025_cov_4.399568_1_plen_169_part_00